jgi:hypothetical protein
MSALRLIAAVLIVLPVAALTLAASAVALALTVAMVPFAYLRNTGPDFGRLCCRRWICCREPLQSKPS